MRPRASRVAGWVAAAASVAFAAVTVWEIASPLQGGHWASMAACAITAENMLRFHLFAAVPHYSAQPPPSYAEYYCRHPYAIYLMEAACRAVFGHHPWVIRVPAVVCSAATPVVLYRLGRACWGAVPAAVATVAFVVVPVDLAFATFSSLEVPTIFFGLLFCLGTVRCWQTGRTSYVLVATLGALGASHSDWIGSVLVAVLLGFAAARMVVRRARRGPSHALADRRWWVACALATLGTTVLYALLIARAGQLGDLLLGARLRSMDYSPVTLGMGDPFRLARRLMRLQWMVPWVGFAALAVAVPVAASRLRTRPQESILLAWTIMASAQYLLFPQGADIHVFWPHYFGPCVALALGTVTSALLGGRRLGRLSRARWAGLAVLVAIPLAALARVAVPMLELSRLTQGRFDERGLYIEPGADASLFAAWATRDQSPDSLIRCTALCGAQVEYSTGLAQLSGAPERAALAPDARDRLELVDARYTPADQLRELATTFDVTAVGPFLRIDRAVRGAGIRAMRYVERQPAGLERLFVTDHDLVHEIGSDVDPWATWQWAEALGTGTPPAPQGEPANLQEMAIAFNVASSSGEGARASEVRQLALAGLSLAATTAFTGDVRLLGATVQDGVVPVVSLLWETGHSFSPARESTFVVRCRTARPPHLWPVPVDELERQVAPPMSLKPSLWRADHLYVQRFTWSRRPGVESCRGYFEPNDLRPEHGRGTVDLAALQPPT